MSLERLQPDEVVALQYDDEAVAEDLARWCGGGVLGRRVLLTDSDGHAIRAELGDWLLRHPDGRYGVLTAIEFAKKYGPQEP